MLLCFRTFCCCWETRTGCLVIGYGSGGISFLGCVGSILRLLLGLPLVMQNDELQGQFPFNALLFVFTAAYFAVHTIASFTLIPAVKETQVILMIPSFVMLIVDILLDGTAIIVLGITAARHDTHQKVYIGGAAVCAIVLPILIYSLLILTSHFEDLFRKGDKIPLRPHSSSKIVSCLSATESAESSDASIGPTTV